jgi:pilus assembly protein FimV
MKRARRSVLLLVAIGALLPTGAYALGLGEIRVHSELNQPLEAEVEVFGARPGEAEELVVSLADSQSFRQTGLDRPHILTTLRFAVARRSDGLPYIKVFTLGDVREPLLTFLVEVDWAKGRIMREFTVLLDPPGMAAGRDPAPVVASSRRPSLVRPAVAATDVAVGARSATGVAASTATDASPDSPAERRHYGPVHKNETLWDIAKATRSSVKVSMAQMMLAYQQINPDAFIHANINRLRAGVVLRIPTTADIAAFERGDALARVDRQNALWQSGSAKAARRGVPGQMADDADSTSGSVATVADVHDRVAKGDTDLTVPPDDAEATLLTGPQEFAENEALREQVASLERKLERLQDLIELKSQEVAELQSIRNRTDVVSHREIARMFPFAAAAENEPPFYLAPMGVAAAEITSDDLDRLASKQLSAIGTPGTQLPSGKLVTPEAAVGVPLVFMLGVAMIYLRRRETGDVAMTRAAPVSGMKPRNHGRTRSASDADIGTNADVAGNGRANRTNAATPGMRGIGEGDDRAARSMLTEGLDKTISEVDIYLAYELHREAEELLREVINENPARKDYRVKLIETYFAAHDKARFIAEAEALQREMSEGDRNHWKRVADMGAQLAPEHWLFGNHAALQAAEQSELDVTDVTLTADDTELLAEDTEPQGDRSTEDDFTLTQTIDLTELNIPSDEPSDEVAENDPLSVEMDDAPDPALPIAADDEPSFESSVEEEFFLDTDLHEPQGPTSPGAVSDTRRVGDTPQPSGAQQIEPLDAPENLDCDPETIDAVGDDDDDDLEVPDALEEVDTMLELAKAFMDIGDVRGARDTLREVLAEGNEEQRAEAERLLKRA